MSSISILPTELLCLIIDEVDLSDSRRRDLAACCLVSGLWHAVAAPHLFRRMSVTLADSTQLAGSQACQGAAQPNLKTLAAFLALLYSSFSVSTYLQELTLRRVLDGCDSYSYKCNNYDIPVSTFIAIINAIPRLRVLHSDQFLLRTDDLEQVRLPRRLDQLAISLGNRPSGADPIEHVRRIVSLFERVKELRVTGFTLLKSSPILPPRSVRQALCIEKFVLQDSTPCRVLTEGLSNLFAGSEDSQAPSLSSLEVGSVIGVDVPALQAFLNKISASLLQFKCVIGCSIYAPEAGLELEYCEHHPHFPMTSSELIYDYQQIHQLCISS